MHHHTELSFVDVFWWISPLHYLEDAWQNAVLLWRMLQAGPSPLRYYGAVVLHSCAILQPVGHSSNHKYNCFQLTKQSSCVRNFYHSFMVYIWLSIVALDSYAPYQCCLLVTLYSCHQFCCPQKTITSCCWLLSFSSPCSEMFPFLVLQQVPYNCPWGLASISNLWEVSSSLVTRVFWNGPLFSGPLVLFPLYSYVAHVW